MPIGRRHALFIQYMIEFGDTPEGQIKAYRLAYPKASHESARSRSHKLSHNIEVAAAIADGRQKRQQLIEEAQREAVITEAKQKIMSQLEVDAVLSDIIKGRFIQKVKKIVFNPFLSKFEIVTVDQPPDASAVIAAIDKYNKRNGAYAAPRKPSDDTPPAKDTQPDIVLIPGEDNDGND